jgi:hypothetical protein
MRRVYISNWSADAAADLAAADLAEGKISPTDEIITECRARRYWPARSKKRRRHRKARKASPLKLIAKPLGKPAVATNPPEITIGMIK